MTYLIAGGLLGAAMVILTVPWSRLDPNDFSNSELGYAWRGPRGAVAGALRTLVEVGAAKRSRKRGVTRTGARLSPHIDPFARAVYGGLGSTGGVTALREMKSVQARLPEVRQRALHTRLRTGVTRRLVGTLATLAAPVVALVGVLRGVDIGVGIPVLAATVLLGGWLLTLRGATVRGARTIAGVTRPHMARDTSGYRSPSLGGLFIPVGGSAWGTPGGDGFGFADGSGYDGGGGDGGGDSSY